MKILIYAIFQEGYGMGHIHRSKALYSYIQKQEREVFFQTNLEDSSLDKDHFDLIIYDAAMYHDSEIVRLKKQTKKLVLLDYFGNHPAIDLSIALFKRDNAVSSSYLHFGLQYSIIKDEILKHKLKRIKNKSQVLDVLIVIGAEDKKAQVRKVLRTLKQSGKLFHITVISKNLKAYQSLGLKVIHFTSNLGKYIAQSDLVICNAGTTLLEVMSIGKPVISVAQNSNEERFYHYIAKKVPLFTLQELQKVALLGRGDREKIMHQYQKLIDGQGKKRIYDLCVKK